MQNQDLPEILGVTMLAAFFIVIANLVVDVAVRRRRPEGEALMPDTLLEVEDLRIHFPTDDGLVKAVDGLSFSLERGRTLGIVGESGSGKSVTSLGIMGLHHGSNARITGRDPAGRRGTGRRLREPDPANCAAARWP